VNSNDSIPGYDTICQYYVPVFGKIAASTSGWKSDFNCTKMAHEVGQKTGSRPLGEPLGISGHLQCQFFPSYLT